MDKQSLLFLEFKDELRSFIKEYQTLKEEMKLMKDEKLELKQKLRLSIQEGRELKQENDRLKVVNAMLGDKEHRRLMKLKLNRLIKEVDQCIVQLKR